MIPSSALLAIKDKTLRRTGEANTDFEYVMVKELTETLRGRLSAKRIQPAAPLGSNRKSPTRLHGRSLRLLRSSYMILFVILLSLFILGIPSQFSKLKSGVIGIYLKQNNAGEFILSPIPGLPAGDVGIQEGDVLIAIDGVYIQPGTEMMRLLQLLRRPPGTEILLDVRDHEDSIRSYSITPAGFPVERFGLSTEAYAKYLIALGIVFVLGFCIPSLIIFLRKSDDWLAMFVSLTLVIIAIYNSAAYAGSSFLPLLVSNAINFVYSISVLLILYIFPDGRFVPRWTRPFSLVGMLWILWKVLPLSFIPSLWTSGLWIILELMLFGTGIYAQIYRYYKVSDLKARQQTKWITFGMAVAYSVQYAYFLPITFIPAFNAPTVLGLGYSILGRTLHHLGMLVLPITVTHAILRRHLYEIDLIINRTLVYVSLSAIVAGTFTAVVTLFKRLFVTLTGETSDVAFVLTTFVVVAMITPVKDWLQARVDKRFKEVPLPTRMLNDFEEQVRTRMFAVDVGPITRRFLEEAVKAFDAESGVAYREKKGNLRRIHTLGEWKGEGKVSIPVEIGGKKITRIMLGERRSGRDYTDQDYEALHHVAQIVGQAIEEDRVSKV